LKKGGNAVDAAIAVSLTLGVVAPAWSGLGGGGFGLIHLSRSDETIAVDYREVAPKAAWSGMFKLDETGKVTNNSNAVGPLAIAVPGEASGIGIMLEKYGTMRLADICRLARDQATKGAPVSPTMNFIMRDNRDNCLDKFRHYEASANVFLRKGRHLRTGERFIIPNLSRTLDAIARDGMQSFYYGNLGERMITYLKGSGAILTQEDLTEYSPRVRTPVTGTYRGFEVRSMPPPSSAGLTIVETLNILEGFDLTKMKHRSAQAIHTIAEALKLGYADRDAYVADPDFVTVPISKLTSKDYADQRRSTMGAGDSSFDSEQVSNTSHEGTSTTHLSVIDKEGDVVALTESIECFFGSGILVPELGVLMNDQMHDFDPLPGRLNSIEPKKRPLSSMSPTLIFKDGEPCLALGSAGGPRIISSVLQVILNMVDFGMTLQRAVAAPRVHCQRDKIRVETELPGPISKALREFGHDIEMTRNRDLFFGGIHAVSFDSASKTYHGAADPRRDGVALAF
jgi:gamma-glutamyltranspeptidase/glutathione hydrolase